MLLLNSRTVEVQKQEGLTQVGCNPRDCEYFTGTKWCPRLDSHNSRAVSARLVTEALKKHVQRTPTPACALPQNSAAGSRCRPGAQTLQWALLSGRAMPLSWTGALRTAVAPTADVPVRQPGHQLPTLCPREHTPLTFLLGGTAALRPE